MVSDLQILQTLDELVNDQEFVDAEDIVKKYPAESLNLILQRLAAMSRSDFDILEYRSGNNGGFKFTGRVGQGVSDDVIRWIVDRNNRLLIR